MEIPKEIDIDEYNAMLEKCQAGCMMTKHHPKGAPHPRFVKLKPNFTVEWGNTAQDKKPKSFALTDIIDIKPGQQTAIFKKKKSDDATAQRSFSILYSKSKSFDVVCDDLAQALAWLVVMGEKLGKSKKVEKPQAPAEPESSEENKAATPIVKDPPAPAVKPSTTEKSSTTEEPTAIEEPSATEEPSTTDKLAKETMAEEKSRGGLFGAGKSQAAEPEPELKPEPEVSPTVQDMFKELLGRPDWPACFWRQYDVVSAKQLKPAEVEGIKTFRARLKADNLLPEKYDDDFTMNRFLRARKYDQDKAYDMWSNYMKWRTKNQVDQLYATAEKEMAERRPQFKQVYTHGFHKTDAYGHPCYFERYGEVKFENLRKVMESKENMLRYYIWEQEHSMMMRFPCATVQSGKVINQTFTLLDLKGVGMSLFGTETKDYLKSVAQISQDYYPEGLYRMHIINAPGFISMVWSFIKGFLDPRTQAKINIHSTKYNKKMLDDIPASDVPDFLGGEDSSCKLTEVGYEDQGPWATGELFAPIDMREEE